MSPQLILFSCPQIHPDLHVPPLADHAEDDPGVLGYLQLSAQPAGLRVAEEGLQGRPQATPGSAAATSQCPAREKHEKNQLDGKAVMR